MDNTNKNNSGITTKQGQLRTSGRKVQPIRDVPSNGVINHNPSQILGQYGKSKGPNDINERFADTGIGDADSQKNQLRQSQGVNRRGVAPAFSGSSAKTTKNTLRKQGMTRQAGKGK
jgi:hypothetical protein